MGTMAESNLRTGFLHLVSNFQWLEVVRLTLQPSRLYCILHQCKIAQPRFGDRNWLKFLEVFVFIVLVMVYHVMLDKTWNPLKWRRNASRQIQDPPPIEVTRRPRAGKLALPSQGKTSTFENAGAVCRFIWAWIK